MSLQELFAAYPNGLTFHSGAGIDLAVSPAGITALQRGNNKRTVLLRVPYRSLRQVAHLLEDYGMRTDQFPVPTRR